MTSPTVHIFYTVLCYETSTLDGQYIDTAQVVVVAQSEDEAIEKAQKLVIKKGYKVTRVEEFLYDHRFDESK
jgi:hypothetical protein